MKKIKKIPLGELPKTKPFVKADNFTALSFYIYKVVKNMGVIDPGKVEGIGMGVSTSNIDEKIEESKKRVSEWLSKKG